MEVSCKSGAQLQQHDVCVAMMLALNQMRLAGQLCDLHLAVENTVLMAHKTILSAASAFFRAAVDQEDTREPAIYRIDGVQTDIMMQALDFMYTGETVLLDSNVSHLKALADQLQIPLLQTACRDYESSRTWDVAHSADIINLVSFVKPDPSSVMTSMAETVVLASEDGSVINLDSDTKVEEVTTFILEESAGIAAADLGSQLMEVVAESDTEAMEIAVESEVETTETKSEVEVEVQEDVHCTQDKALEHLGHDISVSDRDSEDQVALPVGSNGDTASEIGVATSVTSNGPLTAGTDAAELTKCPSHQIKSEKPLSMVMVTNLSHRVRRKRQPKAKEQMLPCPWCSCMYSSENALRDHAKHLHLEQMIKCEYCPRVFVHRRLADNHMDRCCFTSQVDRPDGRYRCPCCKYSVAKLQQAVGHYRKHHTNKTCNTCVHCGQTFQDIDNFHEHLLVTHDMDISNLRRVIHKCTFCEFKTVKRYNFQTHQLTHTQETFSCTHCAKEFKTKMSLQVHVKHLHKRPEKFSCSVCGFYTQYRAHLKMHLYRLHGVMTDDDQTLYSCRFCDYSNMRRSYVEKHELQRHGDIERLKCPSCPKTFRTKLRLEVHERIHTNSFPFKCDQCSFQTRSKENLNAHHKTKHLNIHAYRCPHCGKFMKYSITRHRKRCLKALARQNEEIHYKSKKIQICELCGMVLRSSFSRHRTRCLKAQAKKKPSNAEDAIYENKADSKENNFPGVCEHCGLTIKASLYEHQKQCQKALIGHEVKAESGQPGACLAEPGRRAYMQHVCNYCGEAIKGSMRRHQKHCEKTHAQM